MRMVLLACLAASAAAFSPGVVPQRPAAQFVRRVQQPAVAVVVDIASAEELNEALEQAGDKLVVVDYSTSWCGPCKIIAPKFDEFSEQYSDVSFLKVRPGSQRPSSALSQKWRVHYRPLLPVRHHAHFRCRTTHSRPAGHGR